MSLTDIFDRSKSGQQKPYSALLDLQLWLAQYQTLSSSHDHTPIDINDDTLIVPDDWGPAPSSQQASPTPHPHEKPENQVDWKQPPTTRLPTQSSKEFAPGPVNEDTWEHVLDHLLEREGYRNTVYLDSLGKPTVGVGHLVLPEDNLKVGDTISDEHVRQFLEEDAKKAYKAAIEQANELGINDSDFVISLTSVNYQLGTSWRNTFSNTWQHMKDENYDQAIANIQNSLWAKQTPVRTEDFTNALQDIAAASSAASPPTPPFA
ncbi:MAG: hypothetical protein CMH27_04835 [Micavibrio sp.]|nr:hypothetical protein [Micavibrio sp.]|tara:strand:- start:877 stop:1665 length:789 start_codon:yes stop_codon:yes gene_type:complete